MQVGGRLPAVHVNIFFFSGVAAAYFCGPFYHIVGAVLALA